MPLSAPRFAADAPGRLTRLGGLTRLGVWVPGTHFGAERLGSDLDGALRGSEGLATSLKGLEEGKVDLVTISAASRNAAARSVLIEQAFPECEAGFDLIEQVFPECEAGFDLIEQAFPGCEAGFDLIEQPFPELSRSEEKIEQPFPDLELDKVTSVYSRLRPRWRALAADSGDSGRSRLKVGWAPRVCYHLGMSAGSEALRFTELPGGDLVAAGLQDLRRGVESVPALLAQIGAPRLKQLAIDVPAREPSSPLAEHRFYELLAREHGDNAHSRYNALIRQLVSFTRALACVR